VRQSGVRTPDRMIRHRLYEEMWGEIGGSGEALAEVQLPSGKGWLAHTGGCDGQLCACLARGRQGGAGVPGSRTPWVGQGTAAPGRTAHMLCAVQAGQPVVDGQP